MSLDPELVAAVLEGALVPEERAALAARLRDDGAARRELVDQLTTAQQLAAAFGADEGSRTAASVVALIAAGRTSRRLASAGAVRSRLRPRRRAVRRRRPSPAVPLFGGAVALAAVVVIAVVLTRPPAIDPAQDPTATPALPAVSLESGELRLGGALLAPGNRVPLGRELIAGEAVVVTADGSRLAWSAAELVVHGADRWILRRGRCTASVVPRERDRFRLETPQAAITVLGTRFTVEVAPDATAVAVERGRVRVAPTRGQPVELGPGGVWRSDTAPRAALRADFDAGLDPGWRLHGAMPELGPGVLVLRRRAEDRDRDGGWIGTSGVVTQQAVELPLAIACQVELLQEHDDVLPAITLHRPGDDDPDGALGFVAWRGDGTMMVGRGDDYRVLLREPPPSRFHLRLELRRDELRILIDGVERWRGPHGLAVADALCVGIGGNAKLGVPEGPWLQLDELLVAPLD